MRLRRCLKLNMRISRRCAGRCLSLVLGALFVFYGLGFAKPMYVYVNDRGISVMTDTLDHVPSKYRKTVKVFEMAEETEIEKTKGSQRQISEPNNSGNIVRTVMDHVPTGGVNKQKLMLMGGGLIIVVSFTTLMFSRNMAVKFAMKWLLMCAIVGTGYGWYFSSMGMGSFLGQTGSAEGDQKPIIQRMKEETKEIEKIQKKKLMDMERLLGEEIIPSSKRKP